MALKLLYSIVFIFAGQKIAHVVGQNNIPVVDISDVTDKYWIESTPIYTKLGQVKATDPDGTAVTFSLIGGGYEYFSIDENTGWISLKKNIDYERLGNPRIDMTVIVKDQQQQEKRENIYIYIKDSNDELPVFQNVSAVAKIPEDTQIGHLFYTISVSDLDTQNAILTVECIGDTVNLQDACDTFQLSEIKKSNIWWVGELKLVKKLDYETRVAYQIQLRADDGEHQVDEFIVVEVTDVNDSPPFFVKPDPVTIKEEQPIGTKIIQLTATDTDTNPRDIYYELIGANTDQFQIDGTTGVLSNKVLLDYDKDDSRKNRPWDITVKAREEISPGNYGNDPSTTATVLVKVQMEDINDNTPTFDKNEYRIEIDEDIARGLNLPGLKITVKDIDDTLEFNSFKLETDAHNDIFSVIPADIDGEGSPTLYVKDGDKIDYESGVREYRLVIIATEDETSNPRHTGSATVIITIRDVNDEDPAFDKTSYTVNVSEMANGGTEIIDLNAVDREEGKFGTQGIRYVLFGNFGNHFAINPTTGVISVRQCATPGKSPCIDYETKKQYVLTVSATDNDGTGRAVTTQVNVNIIDQNDNPPKPENNYVRYINEEETVTVNPLLIEASDPDTVGGPVKYRIEGSATQLWKITEGSNTDGTTFANITAKRPIYYIDAPDNGQFIFTVVSYDDAYQSVSQVKIIIIDINNNAPQFTSPNYFATISEKTRGDTFVQTVTATDLDSPNTGNGLIDFAIESGGVGKFQLSNTQRQADNSFTVDVRTTTDASFDYDKQNRYIIVLEARDRGTPTTKTGTSTLTVSIIDENNQVPVITPASTTINVREDSPQGTSVHSVIANDPDANQILRYFMTPESGTKPNGSPSDVDFKNLFEIDQITGIVTVKNPLNRDDVAFIKNGLRVEDQGATPAQTGIGALFIRITEYNDQDPVFVQTRYEVDVEEEIIRNSFILSLSCTDTDDDIASYEISQTAPTTIRKNFELLGDSSAVIVNERIDYEAGLKKIEMLATCWDNGTPKRSATATVVVNVININDNSPVFTEASYSASATEGKRTQEEFLIKVQATDLDLEDFGKVYYQLNDPDNFFRINDQTGDIYIKPNAEFDREASESYVLQVVALDSPNNANVRRSSTAQVIIRIIDVNDNCPVFKKQTYTASVPESAYSKTNILDIVATDLDGGQGGLILYQIKPGSASPQGSEGLFSILTRNNVGRLLTDSVLKGRVGVYSFTVTATDMNGDLTKSPCVKEVPVQVTVQESDNQAPKWVDPPRRDWVIYVLEEQYEGMLVYDTKAVDSNKGPNGIVNYFFLNEQDRLVSNTAEFRINRITGVIRAEIIYDRERVDKYYLTLLAKDSGSPSASSETTITVVILDVDDNDPKFRMQNGAVVPLVLPETQLYENTEVNSLPGQRLLLGNCSYLASDADTSEGDHNRIYYRLITRDLQDTIEVDSNNCKIYLKKAIDFEEKKQLAFDVLAYNLKNDDTVIRYKREVNPSILPVIVNIKDTNDNNPRFLQDEYLTCVSVEAPFKQTIVEVIARDEDLGDQLTYSLNVQSKQFEISGNEGIIRNIVSFKYEDPRQPSYTLDLAVTDTANNKGFAKAHVFITEEANTVKITVDRPLREVENIQRQLIGTIVDTSDDIDFACISSMRIHINQDGEERAGATDVMVTAVKKTSSGTGSNYQVLSASALAGILQTQDSFSAITSADVSSVKEHDEDEFFSMDEDAVLAIFIIIVLLIFLALLLLCIACYCMRRSKKKKKNKLFAQRNTIIHHAAEPVETSFNPVYSNAGYENEYATVQKVQSAAPPINPVVIPAPVDLQPYPTEEPSNLQPIHQHPNYMQEGLVATNSDVFQQESVSQVQTSTFETFHQTESKYEETVDEVEDAAVYVPVEVPPAVSASQVELEDKIEAIIVDEPIVEADTGDQIEAEIIDSLPEPMPDVPTNTDVDVEIQEEPVTGPPVQDFIRELEERVHSD